MNYRHAFHAGNHADVLKHLVLLSLVSALQRKPAPLFVLDTHAGRGDYDLASDEAGRTAEAEGGVTRLLAWARDARPLPAAIARYREALAALGGGTGRTRYPGSPRLIANALRVDDRLAACELQPDEAAALRALFAQDARVGVHARDGYAAMGALLPPKEKRGLVLIDPPYEAQAAEFDAALDALRAALTRWPTGVYTLWYPIKQRRTLQAFLRRAAALPAKQALLAELLVRPDDSPLRMNGSGLLILNPPWQIETELAPALASLRVALGETGASHRLDWLRQEAA
jgi:23S rRNA (adenine2030-N6)-methyltransferase